MNADGEKQRALTQISATGPTWASNGKQIYFSSEMLGGVKVPTLFAVDAAGWGNLHKVMRKRLWHSVKSENT